MTEVVVYGALGPDDVEQAIPTLTASGFDELVLSLFHIGRPEISGQRLGDIVFNGKPIVASEGRINESFVRDWPAQLAKLAAGGVSKLSMSFGGGEPVIDFETVSRIMVDGVIPKTSELYRNFEALRAHFPMVSGIDIDDEDRIESGVILAFAKMALEVGFETVSMCPPGDSFDAWIGAALSLEKAHPGALSRIAPQAYGWAAPSEWADQVAKAGFSKPPALVPGMSAHASPQEVETSFRSWREIAGGGFLWRWGLFDNSGPNNAAAYAQAVRAGLA